MSDLTSRPLALVTGASAGIGAVFVDRLAAKGYNLLLVSRDQGRLEQLGGEMAKKYGVSFEAWAADLSVDADVDRLIERIRSEPRLAMLVNNAGFGTKGTIAKTDVAAQDRMLRLHMLAPARMSQAALPGMIARKRGDIINVASVASWTTVPGGVNYSATKAYLRMFSEGLALELQGTGVRVQALCPGFTYSEFHDRAGVSRSMFPAWMWMSADAVVDYSLAQIFASGNVICLPGIQYKALVFFLKHIQWLLTPLRGRYRKD